MSNQGTIVQIIGAVIDADFSKASKLPEIYNALEILFSLLGRYGGVVNEAWGHVMEVLTHLVKLVGGSYAVVIF